MADEIVLQVEDLMTYFFTRSGVVKAVDGVSFELNRGETLGIVGESGSGKSMTAWSILGLVPEPAGRIVGGRILYQGEDLLQKSRADMREKRGSGICMVMQSPLTSLNPLFTVGTLDPLLDLVFVDRDHHLPEHVDALGHAARLLARYQRDAVLAVLHGGDLGPLANPSGKGCRSANQGAHSRAGKPPGFIPPPDERRHAPTSGGRHRHSPVA